MTVPALLAAFAAVAALAAARERRHRDMGAAAGIAAALSPAGLALLPVLLGTAIARRRLGPAVAAFAIGLAATYLLAGGAAGLDVSAWRWVAVAGVPELRGPLLALAVGGAAWLAASGAARSPSTSEIDRAALLAGLALPALMPLGLEATLPAALLLAQGVRPTLSPFVVAANDDPLPLRSARAA